VLEQTRGARERASASADHSETLDERRSASLNAKEE
jgi:hypothetical protein